MKTRRQFLEKTIGFLAGIGLLLSPLFSLARSVYAKTRKIILPKGTKRSSLVNKDPKSLDTRNLEITPLKDFETMGLDDFAANLKKWRLEVDGHVKAPLRLTYEQILSLPSIKRKVLLICPGIFANHGRWKGVSIGALLKRAGVKEGTTHITVSGPEGSDKKMQQYPIKDILSDKVFLAYAVNGNPLPQKHGYPLRLVAEGYYGYDWIKYVDKVTAQKIEKAERD